jgi:hypothetical protein
MKLLSKKDKIGSKRKKKYDKPKTPYQHSMERPTLDGTSHA